MSDDTFFFFKQSLLFFVIVCFNGKLQADGEESKSSRTHTSVLAATTTVCLR